MVIIHGVGQWVLQHTEKMKIKLQRLLGHVNIYNSTLRFYTSDMILTIESDVAYLV